MSAFRVAISGDLYDDSGAANLPDFDLSRLGETADVEIGIVGRGPVLTGEELADYDALILMMPQFRVESVPATGRLSVIARGGVGYDTVDTGVCTDNGIALVITPDAVRRPVAVSVMTFMLALTGKLVDLDRVARGHWTERTNYMGFGLVGRVFGQLGIGNIGAEVLRLAKPYDLRLIAHDPYADARTAAELGVDLVDLETLFRESDILSVSCPLTDETRAIVNAERLAMMKSTAYLINTSRGPVVDQAALTAALKERRIAGAGLDVLEQEPPNPDDPLLKLDNVLLAPHALCWTDQLFREMARLDIEAVLDVMRGRVPANIVNRAVVDTPKFKARLDAYRSRFGH